MNAIVELSESELAEVAGGCNSVRTCAHEAGVATAEAIEDVWNWIWSFDPVC